MGLWRWGVAREEDGVEEVAGFEGFAGDGFDLGEEEGEGGEEGGGVGGARGLFGGL
jgi:hypothetical protein